MNHSTNTSLIAAALLAIPTVGFIIGWRALPYSSASAPASVVSRLITYDGGWYRSIGDLGYQIRPATEMSNLAFFPAQGLIDKAASLVAGTWAPVPVCVLSLTIAVVSIFMFAHFARMIIGPAAPFATGCPFLTPPHDQGESSVSQPCRRQTILKNTTKKAP